MQNKTKIKIVNNYSLGNMPLSKILEKLCRLRTARKIGDVEVVNNTQLGKLKDNNIVFEIVTDEISTHSKSPWKVTGDCADFDTLAVYNANGMKIVFWGGHYNVPVKEGEANARLIGASPEMYETLKYIKQDLESKRMEGTPAYTKTIQALAKAEGK